MANGFLTIDPQTNGLLVNAAEALKYIDQQAAEQQARTAQIAQVQNQVANTRNSAWDTTRNVIGDTLAAKGGPLAGIIGGLLSAPRTAQEYATETKLMPLMRQDTMARQSLADQFALNKNVSDMQQAGLHSQSTALGNSGAALANFDKANDAYNEAPLPQRDALAKSLQPYIGAKKLFTKKEKSQFINTPAGLYKIADGQDASLVPGSEPKRAPARNVNQTTADLMAIKNDPEADPNERQNASDTLDYIMRLRGQSMDETPQDMSSFDDATVKLLALQGKTPAERRAAMDEWNVRQDAAKLFDQGHHWYKPNELTQEQAIALARSRRQPRAAGTSTASTNSQKTKKYSDLR